MYIVEHLEQADADGKRMSPWCKCEYMHMYDRAGREKLLFTNMDEESGAWLQAGKDTVAPGHPRLGVCRQAICRHF